MRTFASCIGAGLLIAAVCGAALAWDGSAYLFHILDTQTLYLPHNRYINMPLQALVLLAAKLTSAVPVLAMIFSLVYASVPVLALAAAWWIVRRDARQLFVWAALGISIGTLPGQFFFVAEAMVAVQLFWPIWLAVLTRLPARHAPLVIVLSVALLFSHPFAIPLFALAALLALVVGQRAAAERRRMWAWAGGFGVACVASILLLGLQTDPYQADQISPQILRYAFDTAAVGLPLAALACAWIAALALAAAPLLARRGGQRAAALGSTLAVAGIVAAGALLLLWARDGALWKNSLDFRYLALFSSLPFLALAALDSLMRSPSELQREDHVWQSRVQAMQASAIAFMLVLGLQSAVWFSDTSRLRTTLAESRWTCVSAGSQAWMAQTPLQHWSVSTYALLLQGAEPDKVVLSGDGCGDTTLGERLPLNGWTSRAWDGGQFNLSNLRGDLRGEQEYPQGCTFALTSGWHQTEMNGPYWWRWSDGRNAQIRVLAEKDLDAAFTGQIETISGPNKVAVTVNGVQQATLDLAQPGLQALAPLDVAIKRGVNTIQLTSENAPVETQGRSLALSLANLKLASGDKTLTCEFHP